MKDTETFRFVREVDPEQYERVTAALKQGQFRGLGPFPTDTTKNWQKLSLYITPEVVNRISPLGHTIHPEMTEEETKVDDATERFRNLTRCSGSILPRACTIGGEPGRVREVFFSPWRIP